MGLFFKSIYLTLNHILLADYLWLKRFLNKVDSSRVLKKVKDLSFENYPNIIVHENFELLKEDRFEVDNIIIDWISLLKLSQLEESLFYSDRENNRIEIPLNISLTHFFNHQAHHREQVTGAMSKLNIDFGVTDFSYFFLKNL